jgi:hypothetical protein
MDWVPTKEARADETRTSDDDPFGERARQILYRDLTGTGFVPVGNGTCHLDGDFSIFRCSILNPEDETDAVWAYVENDSSGDFSTCFLF